MRDTLLAALTMITFNSRPVTLPTSSPPTILRNTPPRMEMRLLPDAVLPASDLVKSLRPVKFNYILTGKSDIGFIAQEYQRVLPEQITTHQPSGKEKDLTNGDDVLAINQNLVPYLVKAIQEQQILINNLTERLTKLEVK